MTTVAYALVPCQACPVQTGETIHRCPSCGARWRFRPRSLMELDEISWCPGCDSPSGEPVAYKRPLDLDFGGVRSALESAGFRKQLSGATSPEGEQWVHTGCMGKEVTVTFRVSFVYGAEPLRCPVEWVRISRFRDSRERVFGRAWPVDRRGLDYRIGRALSWLL